MNIIKLKESSREPPEPPSLVYAPAIPDKKLLKLQYFMLKYFACIFVHSFKDCVL